MAFQFIPGIVLALFFVFQKGFGWTPHFCHQSRPTKHAYHPSSLHASKIAPMKISKQEGTTTPSHDGGAGVSLAGEYSIVVSSSHGQPAEIGTTTTWSLFPIDAVTAGEGSIIADGARSMKALGISQSTTTTRPAATLSCTWSTNDDSVKISLTKDPTTTTTASTVDLDLLDLLQRIFVQWSWASKRGDPEAASNLCRVSFFQQDQEGDSSSHQLIDFSSDDSSTTVLEETLFAGLVDISSGDIEWVEMVTGSGEILGRVPRRLVHKFNLLHRGIGLFVTKDRPIIMDTSENDFPSMYVHRRCAAKRIFPSMYDMFVGGVSLAGEPPELTARREVAEELGLARALDEQEVWSPPILTCTVCTAYNRCVVTLFSYAMNTQDETITWQEEEVDWGSFVPYPVIVASADRSIQRFANDRKWPGTYPPVQSGSKGSLPPGVDYKDNAWEEWDFVPDGLLVWEAWLDFLDSKS